MALLLLNHMSEVERAGSECRETVVNTRKCPVTETRFPDWGLFLDFIQFT